MIAVRLNNEEYLQHCQVFLKICNQKRSGATRKCVFLTRRNIEGVWITHQLTEF